MDFRDIPVPFHDYLGIRVVRTGSPARLELDLGEHVRGAVAPIHGGVAASLVDVACGAAVSEEDLDPLTTLPVSTDLSLRFFRQPGTSPLVAEATVVHRGSRLVVAECVVTDGAGKQVARGGGSYLLVTGFHDHSRTDG
ncbi:MAG: PaaI family thioesterase [Mycobacteriales bacterium]